VAEKHDAINVWPEDNRDNNFLRKVIIRVADNTVSHPRRPSSVVYCSVSQPPGRGPVPGPGINYTGPREILLEFVTLVF